jgi:hypothetical protein
VSRTPLHCFECCAAILPGDDAQVCIECGGMNQRRYPAWCCQLCGSQVGYFGRALSWLFGTQIHGCAEARRTTSTAVDANGKKGE